MSWDGRPDGRAEVLGYRVYFIQDARGPVKIGFTTNVEKRLMLLQAGNPYPLKILGTFIGDKKDEGKLHVRFAKLRLCGEWFAPGDELLEYLKRFDA